VLGVMIGPTFVTVTKAPAADWQAMVEPITKKIKELLASGKELFSLSAQTMHATGNESEVEQRIKDILDNEIRPAVAMDGGDITFYSYENGVVTLHLQGACSSCPSSIMTLKMGVENRLKQAVPEVKEVVQV
ncbi:MAG: NifU family protein, partial [Candidatus Omnitrophota bacterium]